MMPDLPEELLQQIFANLEVPGPSVNYLEPRLRRQTLTAVCRANKQCCRLAQPILFSTIHLGGVKKISIRAFWELLVGKPRLATLVRSLHIEYWEYPQDDDEQDYTTEVSQALQDATKSAMDPLRRIMGPSYDMALSRQLAGIEDGMLAYIIALCENLNLLELVVPHLFSESTSVYLLLEWLAHLALTNGRTVGTKQVTRNLPHLRELHMQHWDTENAFRISDAIPFWTFRNLRTFKGNMVTCELGYGLREYPTVKESNIRELYLDDALIEAEALRFLLRHCPRLEILSIVWGSATVGDCSIDHELLGQALRHYPNIEKNLKKLVLNPLWAFDYEHFDGEFSGPIGSLKSFESLQYLGLSPRGLIGEDDEDSDGYPNFESLSLMDMLPESLHTLDVLTGSYNMNAETEATIKTNSEVAPLDNQLYALMGDDRFNKLSAIKMHRPINESKTTLKDVGWRETALHPPWMWGGKEFVLSRDVEQNADS